VNAFDEEEKFILDIVCGWADEITDAYNRKAKHLINDNILFLLNNPYIEDITKIERIINLSHRGKIFFLLKSFESIINGWMGIIQKLSTEDKKNLSKQMQERIKSQMMLEDVLVPLWALMPKSYFQGEIILRESDPFYKDLPDEDKDFLIDFFSKNEQESDETLKDGNDCISMLKNESKKYRIPPFEKIKDLIRRTEGEPRNTIRKLEDDYIREYTRKDLTISHKILIVRARTEIKEIYDFIQVNISDIWTVKEKIQKFKELAPSYVINHPKNFSLVKSEYLNNQKFYDNFPGYFKNRQVKSVFYGRILNRIFEGNGLDSLDRKIIIGEVRKIEKNI